MRSHLRLCILTGHGNSVYRKFKAFAENMEAGKDRKSLQQRLVLLRGTQGCEGSPCLKGFFRGFRVPFVFFVSKIALALKFPLGRSNVSFSVIYMVPKRGSP